MDQTCTAHPWRFYPTQSAWLRNNNSAIEDYHGLNVNPQCARATQLYSEHKTTTQKHQLNAGKVRRVMRCLVHTLIVRCMHIHFITLFFTLRLGDYFAVAAAIFSIEIISVSHLVKTQLNWTKRTSSSFWRHSPASKTTAQWLSIPVNYDVIRLLRQLWRHHRAVLIRAEADVLGP